jgi:hypothetical protein
MTPNEAINSARGLKEGDTGALPTGGKTAWSMTDDMNARTQAAKVLNEKSESDFRIAQAKFEMEKLALEAEKLSQMANAENEKAFTDSMAMSTRFRDNLKDRLNDPLTPAADKDKLHAQIDSMDDMMMKAYKNAHKGQTPPAAGLSPDAGAAAAPVSVDKDPTVAKALTTLSGSRPDKARDLINTSTVLTPAQKTEALRQLHQKRKDDVEYNRELLKGLGNEVIRQITGRLPV